MNRRGGFTLLEVVVTLSLVALLFAVTTVRFHSLFAASRLQAAGRSLGDHFAYGISRSYTTGKYHSLFFDLTNGGYRLQLGRQDEGGQVLLKDRLSQGIKFTDIQVGADLYLPPGSLTVEISPLGVTSDLLVNLEDEHERPFAVALNSLVQSLDFYEEHKTYSELQSEPSF